MISFPSSPSSAEISLQAVIALSPDVSYNLQQAPWVLRDCDVEKSTERLFGQELACPIPPLPSNPWSVGFCRYLGITVGIYRCFVFKQIRWIVTQNSDKHCERAKDLDRPFDLCFQAHELEFEAQ